MGKMVFDKIENFNIQIKNGSMEVTKIIDDTYNNFKVGDILKIGTDGTVRGYRILESFENNKTFSSTYSYYITNTPNFIHKYLKHCGLELHTKATEDEEVEFKKICLTNNLWFDSYETNRWIRLTPRQEYVINDVWYQYICFDEKYGLIVGINDCNITNIFVNEISSIRDYSLDELYYEP